MSMSSLPLLALVPFAAAQSPNQLPALGGDPGRPGMHEEIDANGAIARAFVDTRAHRSDTTPEGGQALAEDNWTAIGPFGGDVADAAASPTSPNMVLAAIDPAGTGGALYRSTDAGASWTEVPDLDGVSCQDIEFDPAGRAYVGTWNGVWKSLDDGQNWTSLPLGIGFNDEVLEITIDPNDSDSLWVGVDRAIGNQANTLLHSTDGGTTWTSRVPGGGPYSFRGIALDPGDSNRVFAAWEGSFSGGGVFFSDDGGTTWTDRSAGLPSNPMTDLLHDGSRLLLCGGQLLSGQNVGVWTTSDEGLSWTELSDPTWPSRAISDLEIGASTGARILCTSLGAGVFESLDGGFSWSFGVGGTHGLSCRNLSISPANLSELFLGCDSKAAWKSVDGGASFTHSSVGINMIDLASVATNPLNPLEVAVAYRGLNSGGVMTSGDGGQSWTDEPLPGNRVNAVEFAPDGTLFALVDGPIFIAPEGLYRREGALWNNLGPDQGTHFETMLLAMAFDPLDPNVVYLGGRDHGQAGYEGTLWRSATLGPPWTKVYEGVEDFDEVMAISHVVAGSGQYVASYRDLSPPQEGGALRSADNGLSWTESNTGLAIGTQGYDLSLAPDDSTLLLADSEAQNGGLYRSTDGGQSWLQIVDAPNTGGVVHNPSDGDEVLTIQYALPRVRASADGGVNLEDYATGLDEFAYMRDLFVVADGSAFYVATNRGAWRSDNPIGINFCVTSPNSVGPGAVMAASGSASVAANNLVLRATGLPGNRPGLFFYGPMPTQVPLGNGFRCVAPGGLGLFRLPVVVSTPAGSASLAVDYGAQPNPLGQIQPGSVWHFQLWYRDPVDPPFGNNLTDGLKITFEN